MLKLIPALCLLIFTFNTEASPFRGPFSGAMGGTGRAGIESSEGAFLNPASLVLIDGREIGLYYHDGTPQENQHSTDYGLGFADNTKGLLLSGAFHYIKGREMGLADTAANSELLHVALARTLMPGLSVGVSGYRIAYTGDGAVGGTQWNFTLGGIYMITPEVGVGYVLDNPARAGANVPIGLRQETQQGIGFFGSIMDILRVRLDITRNETDNPGKRLVYMAGLENLANEWLIVRLGYRNDDQFNQTFLTAGFGFNGPRLKLDYAFEKALRGTSGALHSVDIRIPF